MQVPLSEEYLMAIHGMLREHLPPGMVEQITLPS